MWSLEKFLQMNLLAKQKQTHRRKEQTYGYQGGRGEWEYGVTGIYIYIDYYV